MLSEQAWGEIACSLKLSTRELQIVRGIFDGCKEFAIAADLGLSPNTIHTHSGRLYRKLGVTDRAMLVRRIYEKFIALTVAPGSALPPITCAKLTAGRRPLRDSHET
jgi:DNA-binding NarL/FixJ family response regulator